MADKQVKVAKPEKPTPNPVKPEPTKPVTVKPAKAHRQCCIRCDKSITEESGIVRKVCSACDLDLQTMHWRIEHSLHNKVTYMPERSDEDCSAEWFANEPTTKDFIRKLAPPRYRSFFKKRRVSEALVL